MTKKKPVSRPKRGRPRVSDAEKRRRGYYERGKARDVEPLDPAEPRVIEDAPETWFVHASEREQFLSPLLGQLLLPAELREESGKEQRDGQAI